MISEVIYFKPLLASTLAPGESRPQARSTTLIPFIVIHRTLVLRPCIPERTCGVSLVLLSAPTPSRFILYLEDCLPDGLLLLNAFLQEVISLVPDAHELRLQVEVLLPESLLFLQVVASCLLPKGLLRGGLSHLGQGACLPDTGLLGLRRPLLGLRLLLLLG